MNADGKVCIKLSSASLLLPLSLQRLIFVQLHLNLSFLSVWAMWFIFLTSIQFSHHSSHWTPTAINQEVSLHIPVLFPTLSAFSTSSIKKNIPRWMDFKVRNLILMKLHVFNSLRMYSVCPTFCILLLYWKQENIFTMIKSEINNWPNCICFVNYDCLTHKNWKYSLFSKETIIGLTKLGLETSVRFQHALCLVFSTS